MSDFTFADNEVFCLGNNEGGKGTAITDGEYLIYAASIVQSSMSDNDSDIWKLIVKDDEGNNITYEEHLKREIVNQIRATYILNMKAEDYHQALSDDELISISSDAQTYYDSLSQFDIGSVGIDLSLIVKIYKENALAEKVYNAIVSDVIINEGMTEEEQIDAKLKHFNSVYEKMKKESCKTWNYKDYINYKVLNELSFANLYND